MPRARPLIPNMRNECFGSIELGHQDQRGPTRLVFSMNQFD